MPCGSSAENTDTHKESGITVWPFIGFSYFLLANVWVAALLVTFPPLEYPAENASTVCATLGS